MKKNNWRDPFRYKYSHWKHDREKYTFCKLVWYRSHGMQDLDTQIDYLAAKLARKFVRRNFP